MDRRRFEHLVVELSVAAGHLVPRYALWLRLQQLGTDPVGLSREALIAFHDTHLKSFLAEHGLSLAPRAERRLRRTLLRYDPAHPTPEETLQRLFEAHGGGPGR